MSSDNDYACDYLVVGAGAMSLAFVDTLITENENVNVIIIDDRNEPGGHWVDSYSFVSLQQPSCFYGVNSENLGVTKLDTVNLVPGKGVASYFLTVMNKLTSTGRVRYFNNAKHLAMGKFYYIKNQYNIIDVKYHKLVIGSYSDLKIPSRNSPDYSIDQSIKKITPNELPSHVSLNTPYIIIGGGKTGIDCCLWLLKYGIEAGHIQWVIPNDSWFLMREKFFKISNFIPTHLFLFNAIASLQNTRKVMFLLEKNKIVSRLSGTVEPTKNRCATISVDEFNAIHKIKNIIRKGRVQKITPTQIEFEKENISIAASSLIVDCTSDGSPHKKEIPVFDNKLITLQTLYTCLPTFSAAMIAFVETHFENSEIKNQYTSPVPIPSTTEDFIKSTLVSFNNICKWASRLKIIKFMLKSRLFYMSHISTLYVMKNFISMISTYKKLKKININNIT